MVEKEEQVLTEVTVRFAGDSGDGMQLAGTQFTDVAAHVGNDISTLPDYPAEIRAPQGTVAGVSGFQIRIGGHDIHTPGDAVDVLIAMNPAALKVNLRDVRPQGTLVVNEDAFTAANLRKAGYEQNPLEDGSLGGYRVLSIPISRLNAEAVKDTGLPRSQQDRCKNFFALGLMLWMYSRPLDPVVAWIRKRFKKQPELARANEASLRAGYNFGSTTELIRVHYRVPRADLAPGTYRKITGNQATAIGFVTAARLAERPLVYASYPITPASDILHELATYKHYNVRTIQAEDEIAAVCAALGASYAGAVGLTGTSGPGFSLKAESLGLAVMVELPLVVIDVQRGGPSTGLPTKPEQGDLLQALFGRHGESPVVVLAPATPPECFTLAIEAVRIAIKYMTPVVFLSDAFLANTAEPWRLPDPGTLPDLRPRGTIDRETFQPYRREPGTLARPWAVPGTPGLEHRIGGLEKEAVTGHVSYAPENHELMVKTRAAKVAGVAADIPPVEVVGPPEGDLLVVGWGSTYGALTDAVAEAQEAGLHVAHAHLRYLHPFPSNLGEVLSRFRRVLVAEHNLGQLELLLRAKYGARTVGLHKVQGRPFTTQEIFQRIVALTRSSTHV